MISELLYTESPETMTPRVLDWVHIQDDGSEQPRRGVLWAEGPRWNRHETLWAAVQWSRTRWAYALVVRPARRHRTRGGKGRYVDPGEFYSDAHSLAHATGPAAPWRRDGWGGQPKSTRLRRVDGWEQETAIDWDRWVGWKLKTELPTFIYKTLSNEG